MDASAVLAQIAPPLDESLAKSMLSAFVEQEQRFLAGDFKPSTLDGGHFCEAVARLVYSIDSGTLASKKSVDECLKRIDDTRPDVAHQFPQIDAARQIGRVIRSIYKVRSSRGAVHLSPDYTANELDSRLVLDNSRWILAEMLRIFWPQAKAEDLALTVAELVEFESPLIAVYDQLPFVLRTDLSAAEEILLVLLWYGTGGCDRTTLLAAVRRPKKTTSNTIARLVSASDRRVVRLADGHYRLTPLGAKSVRPLGVLPGHAVLES